MKKLQRLLALALCLLMSLATLPPALAEEWVPQAQSEESAAEALAEPAAPTEPAAPAEEGEAPDAPAEAPAEEPDEVPGGEPSVPSEVPDDAISDPSELPDDAPAEDNPAAQEPLPEDAAAQEEIADALPAIDTTRSAAHSPDFLCGYAELLGSADGYPDARGDGANLRICGGVVYASARSDERMRVHFDGGDGALSAWVSVDRLRPMAQDEALAFVRILTSARQFYDDDPDLPLAALEYEVVAPVVPEMLLGARELKLGVGEKVPVPVSFSDGRTHGLTYISSKSSYAKVSADGVLSPLRSGKTVTITVTSEFGQSAALKLTICKAPTSIDVQPAKGDLCPGEGLNVTAKLSARSASAIAWSSDNPEVATVDADGQVRAVAPGSAVIRGTTFNGKTDTLQLTVHSHPESVRLDPAALTLGVGETAKFKSVAAPDDFGSRVYRSSNPEVAAVDALTGEVRAMSVGSAVISVETYNGVRAECAVEVKAAPSCIRLSEDAVVLGMGERLPLPAVEIGAPGEDCAGGYAIENRKAKYVTVADGMLQGHRTGSVSITFKTYNGLSAALKVTIRKAPRKLTLTPARAALGVGECLALKAALDKGAAGSVRYESSAPEVAAVDALTGEVRALSVGSATITATSYNGKSAKCAIEVLRAPDTLLLGAGALTLGAGENCVLTAELPEGCAGAHRFESDNPEVAAVDDGGRITARAAGSAVVRAIAYNGAEAACAVTVKAAPTGVAFQEEKLTIAVGDSYQLLPLNLLGEDVGAAAPHLKSSSARLSVTSGGLLTTKRTGKATITATTYNGKKASLQVTIAAAPKSIGFQEERLRMCVGMEYAPQLNLGAVSCSYTLTSSNPEVAAIAGDGRTIIARSGGAATITATSYNGKTATIELAVPPLPESIALAPNRITLGVGDVLTLRAVMPEDQDSSLAYESSAPGVAAVDETGAVRAVAPGEAAIRVRTYNGLESSCAVTVLEAPTRVELVPARAVRSIAEGEMQLQLRYGGANQGGRCSYESGDPEVASVGSDGRVTLHGAGETVITVRTYNGLEARCRLTVGETPGRMYFEQAEYAVAQGDTIHLEASFDRGCESHSFAVADGRIAAARGDAITGLSIGRTALTATSFSGLTASCALNVLPAPTGLELDQTQLRITIGVTPSPAIHARALPDGVGSVRYESSDPAVALVDAESGAITPVSAGDCVLTAVSYNGLRASCALQVRGLLDGVKIGIDPGHQAKPDYSREAVAPGKSGSKAKVSSGTGGVSTHVSEHVVNLQVGLRLRDALEALGAEVYMTRTVADVNISNQQRAKMMNELGVDLVLRIHCNGSKNRSWNGMSIYVRQSGVGKDESARAAGLILDAMAAQTGAKNLGVKYSDSYTGLNWSTVPSMLMEMGYLSNAREDRLLNSADYQDKLVAGMIEGICGYMGRPAPGAVGQIETEG